MKILAHISVAVLTGSIMCVSFVVAPTAVAALDESELVFGMVGDIINTVDLFGIVTAILLLVAWTDRLSRILAGVIGLCAVSNIFVVAPQVDGVNIWHHISVSLWMLVLVSGMVFLVRQARRATTARANSA
jgi:hypothetical protein